MPYRSFRFLFLLVSFYAAAQTAQAATEPTVAASNLTVFVNCGQFDIVWTSGNGYQRLVLVSGNPIGSSQLPVDGIAYSANSVYGSGATINGAYVVWSNSGSSITVTGLTNNQTYYVAVFEYNGNGSGINYLTSTYPSASATPIGVNVNVTSNKSTMCSGETATLSAHSNGAIAFTWNPTTNLTTFVDSVAQVNPSTSAAYTVTAYDASGCTATASFSITVNPTPTVTLGTFANTCTNSPPVVLSGGSPSGGTYSGQGVTGTTFSSTTSGTFNIIYSYTNSSGCTDRDTSTIRVNSAPAVTLSSFSSKCINASPFALTGGSPSGGTYSGVGVSNNTFYPLVAGVGSTTIIYSYTSSTTGCSNNASRNLTVADTTFVTQSAFPSVCEDFSPFQLTGSSPSGGVYSGTGVSGTSTFTPSVAGPGTFNITYRYTSTNSCVSSVTQQLTVYPLPTVTFTAPPAFCSNNGNVLLSGGLPNGGFYTGTYVSNNYFNTVSSGSGQFQINYSYTNGNGCSNTTNGTVSVNQSPVVSLPAIPPLCANSQPFSLNTASPSGGYYYGDGIVANQFFPALADTASVRIFYSYTDNNGCSGLDSADIAIRPVPEATLPSFPSRCVNIGPYPLSGGLPAGGSYFGRGVANSIFYSAVAGVGVDSVFYTFTDTNGCTDTALSTITVFPFNTVNVGPDTTICSNDYIVLDAGNPGCTYLWSTGATTQTITADSTGRGLGTFLFWVKVTNAYTCFNRDSTYVTISSCVGLFSEPLGLKGISLYPNPFSGQTVIELERAMELTVSDMSGRIVLQQDLPRGKNFVGETLEKGVYFATFRADGRSAGMRFIKQ
jgi:hypothetical protein